MRLGKERVFNDNNNNNNLNQIYLNHITYHMPLDRFVVWFLYTRVFEMNIFVAGLDMRVYFAFIITEAPVLGGVRRR